MKNTFKIFAVLLTACTFICTPINVKANEDDKPWFITENTYDGEEHMDPSNYNEEDVFGSQYKHANAAVSGTATPEVVNHFSLIRVLSYLINPFSILLGLGTVGAILTNKQRKDEKELEAKKVSLEERKIALQEREFALKEAKENSTVQETTSKPYVPSNKKPVTTTTKKSSDDYVLATEILTAAANSNLNVNDIDGDGVIDSLDIPSFMR